MSSRGDPYLTAEDAETVHKMREMVRTEVLRTCTFKIDYLDPICKKKGCSLEKRESLLRPFRNDLKKFS